jgi:tRNA 2-thiouridine synthesizing protein A
LVQWKGQDVEFDVDLDCEGLLCPLPVLRARKTLMAMLPGQILHMRATDPMAAVDLPHFCAEAGHDFLNSHQAGRVGHYFIRRKD